jgi:hypothetical protein
MTHAFIHDGDLSKGSFIEIAGRVEDALRAYLAAETKPLTLTRVKEGIMHKPSSARDASTVIAITKWRITLTEGAKATVLTVGYAPKPSVNEIRDFRTRPAPFVRGGGCRG